MLKVFLPTDTNFTSNGELGIVPLLALVHKADNSDYYLELVTDTSYIDYIKPNYIIVAPTPTGEQPFRIITVENTRGKITARCEHIYYDTSRYIIADSYVVNNTCNYALDHLNNACDETTPFTTSSNVTTLNSYRCVRTTLNDAIQEVLNRWGGHLVRNKYNISIMQSIGADNGIVIRYGKNLKEITVKYDWSTVCTKLLPVGKDGFTLDNLYVFSDIQYELPFTQTVSFNQEINQQDYETEEQYIQALREDLTRQANEYLSVYQYPTINYTLSANLEKITDIGDVIEVIDEQLGVNITTRVLSFVYDCILGQYTEVQFGNTVPSLKNLLQTISNNIKDNINENNQTISVTINDRLSESEEKILGIMGNSYVIYDGDKILVVDALPKENAHNVIRINSQGIGFSNTGISGTFTSAWTIDGTFNCQAVNLINLTADLIKGGTLKLGSNLNQSGLLEVYDSANNLITELNKDGLKMYGIDGSYILMNNSVGFVGYDRNDTPVFWVNRDEFHQKKAVVEEEITYMDKMRFIAITLTDDNDEVINDGVGIISVNESDLTGGSLSGYF